MFYAHMVIDSRIRGNDECGVGTSPKVAPNDERTPYHDGHHAAIKMARWAHKDRLRGLKCGLKN